MHIGLLTFEFPDARPGGVGAYTLNAARALAEAGHHAHVFTLTLPGDVRVALSRQFAELRDFFHLHETPDLAELVTSGALPGASAGLVLNGGLPVYKLAVGSLLADLVRQVHAETPLDVIEAAEYEALGLPLMLSPIPGLPVVTQIHLSSAVNRWAEGFAASPQDDLTDALERAAILAADGVYAATANIVATTRRHLPFARAAEVIAYPVFGGRHATAPPADGAILYVGRLQKRKGVDILAAAAELVLRKLPGITFRVAGSDTATSDHASMREYMTSLLSPELRERFVFLGELSRTQVQAELAAARFTVAPSLAENFANTALDALAAGRPVIYARGTGLDEVVGDAGLGVSPLTAAGLADAILRLATDPALLTDLANRAARRGAEAFPLAETTAQRIAFYRHVIEQAKAAGRPAVLAERLAPLTAGQSTAVLQALAGLVHGAVGAPAGPPSPGQRTLNRLLDLQRRFGRAPVVYLFGAGRHTQRLLAERHLWESRGLALAGIIDDHPRFATGESGPARYLDLPVVSRKGLLDDLARGHLRVDAIILSTDTLTEQFKDLTAAFRAEPYRILTCELYGEKS